MHGQPETSQVPRTTWVILHLILVGVAGWIYFGGGIQTVTTWLGTASGPGDMARRVVLFAFSIILWSRMSFGAFYLLKRKFGWDEFGGVLLATIIYQVGFAMLGAAESAPIGLIDIAAIALFLFGSYLNTGSELARHRFKARPENQGKLYTVGLFRFSRHINYFGDLLWVTAWALLTRNPWAGLIPVMLAGAFIFAFIPSLDSYLQAHYGDQYTAWAQETKRFIPFIY